MKEKKTYAELMKSRNTQKGNELDVTMLDVYIQMVLDEALFTRRLTTLTEKINKALDNRDEEAFIALSREYQKLLENT
ncbi:MULTISPECIES: IDEAL domain-containing protein [Bacillus]|uniref:IDEAL domain-containing protein n=2 Tax=Bacillus TaxID=1386 RepID=A0A0M4FEM0_9BACI|nr:MULTISPECIES: IDEAL domain-containing protein [Bacillus]ALC80661.1 hypothetical protein AM592_02970 [Bacillus gobiensis]MBP1079550.1 uncharacterized protein YpiB (UPF0302 family) [Bacillus capparidis]MED1094951.1 IDEAL domain-containing protein [Bacillus capparidis]